MKRGNGQMGNRFFSENSERSVAGSDGDMHLCRRYTEKCVIVSYVSFLNAEEVVSYGLSSMTKLLAD